jgi:L-threonine-O-3-phosphate decarboxylase
VSVSGTRREISQPHGGDLAGLCAQLGLDRNDLIDFSVNVNPLGPPESVVDYLRRGRTDASRYPDPEASALIEAAARRHRVEDANIIVGTGAAELLYWLCAYLKPRRAVVLAPAFADYARAAAANGADIVSVRLDEGAGFAVDWPAVERAVRGADIVVLGHPNNPTGRLADKAELVNFIERHPNTLTVVDEAFIDFAGGDDLSLVDMAVERGNAVVLRSLTKNYAIPDLRLGYLVGRADRIGEWRRARPPWPLSEGQIEAGRLALNETGFLELTRSRTAELREELYRELAGISWLAPFASDANFILVKILAEGMDDLTLLEELARMGVIVRACRSFEVLAGRYVRTAVLGERKNRRLIEALQDISK